MSDIGNRSAVVAVEIRPPPARIKIGALACYGFKEIMFPLSMRGKWAIKLWKKLENLKESKRDLFSVTY